MYNQELTKGSEKLVKDMKDFHVDLTTAFARNPQLSLSPDYRRKKANQFYLKHFGKIEEIAETKEFMVRNIVDLHEIPVRLYKNHHEKSENLLIYIRGGGWIQGNLDTHDYICKKLAHYLNVDVLSVDYRLAPEKVFPVQLNDVLSAYIWSYSELKYEHIMLAGDSGGGNLCAALCIKLAEKSEKIIAPEAQILFYPHLGNDFESTSFQVFENCPALSKVAVVFFLSKYTGISDMYDSMFCNNKLIYPLLEDDMTVFPKTIIISAGHDVLLDSQLEFAEKLRKSNREVYHIIDQGAVHGFMTFGKYFEDEVNKNCCRIRDFLHRTDQIFE